MAEHRNAYDPVAAGETPARHSPAGRRKALLACAGGIIAALALGEIFCRIVFPSASLDAFPRLAWTRWSWRSLDEYDIVMNYGAWGHRLPDVPLKKGPGTYRIVALGDSFTEGAGVADAEVWPSVCANTLREKGIQAEVVNLGFRGEDPSGYLKRLAIMGLAFKPDVVVVCVFQNDCLIDESQHALPDVAVKETIRKPSASALFSAVSRMLRGEAPMTPLASHDVFPPVPHFRNHLSKFPDFRPKNRWEAAAMRGEMNPFDVVVAARDRYQRLAHCRDFGTIEGIRLAIGALARMDDLCRERGVRMAVMYVPFEISFSSRTAPVLSDFGMDVTGLPAPRDVMRETISRWCARRGVPMTDTTPALRATPRSYYNFDTHATPDGQKVLGACAARLVRPMAENNKSGVDDPLEGCLKECETARDDERFGSDFAYMAGTLRDQVVILYSCGRKDEAAKICWQLISACEKEGRKEWLAEALVLRARIAADSGTTDDALSNLDKAIEICVEKGILYTGLDAMTLKARNLPHGRRHERLDTLRKAAYLCSFFRLSLEYEPVLEMLAGDLRDAGLTQGADGCALELDAVRARLDGKAEQRLSDVQRESRERFNDWAAAGGPPDRKGRQ
ncbi:MAG TPA: GDSL-type esterase/lipase family protein [Candidatus Brocadiia bacterium]|nr:GDSL-type esterase/lipase family protein [Candidatus Brocadiia bacterium]